MYTLRYTRVGNTVVHPEVYTVVHTWDTYHGTPLYTPGIPTMVHPVVYPGMRG